MTSISKDGEYIKDLSYLNRPVHDVIYVDWTEDNAKLHKENTIVLPQWTGDGHDRELYDIMSFLEYVGQSHGKKATDMLA